MIEYIKKNVSVDKPEISPRLVTGNLLPMDDSSADLVYMITVHHELDNPQEMLKQARRILKSGGCIFIVDWNMNDLKMGPSAEIRLSAGQVAEQLKEAGFSNVRIDPGFDNFFLVIAEG